MVKIDKDIFKSKTMVKNPKTHLLRLANGNLKDCQDNNKPHFMF
jgi:hypothetical protein